MLDYLQFEFIQAPMPVRILVRRLLHVESAAFE